MKHLEEVIKESTPTLVVFQHINETNGAAEDTIFEELKTKYDGKANLCTVDCSKNGSYKERYHFAGYPTWILFKEGQELAREGGHKTLAQLSAMLDTAL
ncbi:MAG: hypothetical protein K2G35_11210 [Duncaniella sp.]|nr:hypothetical protein [Duncaniella sp.]